MIISVLISHLQTLLAEQGDLRLDSMYVSRALGNVHAKFENDNGWGKEFLFINPAELPQSTLIEDHDD